MATKEQKNSKIAEIKDAFERAQVALLSDPTSLTVFEITKLRRELQKEGADLKVVKNTLAIKAVEGTQYECLKDMFKGPVAVAFGFNDQVSPAKILTKFAKELDKAEVKGGALDGKTLSKDEVIALSKLPSREELYAKMMACLNSPATGIAGCINGVASGLARAIDQVRQQKTA